MTQQNIHSTIFAIQVRSLLAAIVIVILCCGCGGGGTNHAFGPPTPQPSPTASVSPFPSPLKASPTASPTPESTTAAARDAAQRPAPRSESPQVQGTGGRVIPYMAPGVTYNGLHATTSPTAAQVTADLQTVKARFDAVRTYYPQFNGNIDVGQIANAQGLKILIGLYIFSDHADWTEGNYNNFVKPAIARGNVLAVVIGNEDPQNLDTIVDYLQRVKRDFPNVPVTTVQTSDFWLGDPRAARVAPLVDFVGVNIYPAWDWQSPINNQPALGGQPLTPSTAIETFKSTFGSVARKYDGKQIVVTETGWPTTYGWVVNAPAPPQPPEGITNASNYLRLVKEWAASTQTNVFVYSMFDDIYGVNTSSQFNLHFGLIDWKGNPKGINF